MKSCVVFAAVLCCSLLLSGCGCAAWHWDPPSPLMAAIRNNDVETVRTIVQNHDENLDAERLHRHAMYGDLDFTGATPLTLAIGRPELLRILVQGGAAIEGRMPNDRTALGYAVEYDLSDSVAVLLELGADPMLPVFAIETYTIYEEAMKSQSERVRELMRAWAERRGSGNDR